MLMFGSLLASTRASENLDDGSYFGELLAANSVGAESFETTEVEEGEGSKSFISFGCELCCTAPGELLRDLGEVDRDLDLDSDAEIIQVVFKLF